MTQNVRTYERIWLEIAKTVDPTVWVTVQALSEAQMQTIIGMVQLEKSRANMARKSLGLPSWGRLEIRREPKQLKLHFKLRNAGAQL